jgi:hypothetical protein
MSDEVQHIDLVLPKNARNVSVTFQIPNNDSGNITMNYGFHKHGDLTLVNTKPSVLDETITSKVPSRSLSKTKRAITFSEIYPRKNIVELAECSGLSRSFIGAVRNVLKHGIPELQKMLRNEETNATYLYRFMIGLPVEEQRKCIQEFGVHAVIDYNRFLNEERRKYGTIYKKRYGYGNNNTTVNVFK